MKNKFYLHLILIFCMFFLLSEIGNAQSAFSLNPGNSVSEMVSILPNDSGYAELTIYLVNQNQGPLVLEWKTISNTLPSNWDIQLCDWTKCFSDVIAGRVMDTISSGGQGFIKLTIGPIHPSTIGTGTAIFDVWVYGDTADKVTLTYDIDALVGIEDKLLESNIQVYPNPFQNKIFVESGSLPLDQVNIFDLNGRAIKGVETTTSYLEGISTENLLPGVYFLEAISGKRSQIKKILKN